MWSETNGVESTSEASTGKILPQCSSTDLDVKLDDKRKTIHVGTEPILKRYHNCGSLGTCKSDINCIPFMFLAKHMKHDGAECFRTSCCFYDKHKGDLIQFVGEGYG
uniref:Uncharacterized protein n=1 Tax=Romanomermis culicivorax TaxID=13658 RepID=A0A915HVB7_ROMCU